VDEQHERELIERCLGRRGDARFPRRDVVELTLHLPHDVGEARRLITNTLRIEGGAAIAVLEDELGAVVGSEIGGVRPAVVSLAATRDPEGRGTRVRIRGVAVGRRGRQRGGRKAAEAVADRLRLVSGLTP
jgi:hypothetical protein